jgi:hypothetical protein
MRSLDVSVSPFGNSIPRIVGRRSNEQMPRVAAGRIVALVEHPEAIRDRAYDQLPCKAMRLDHRHPAPKAKLPVPAPIYTPGPYPARPKIRCALRKRSILVDLEPEPCFRRSRREVGVEARATTVEHLPACDLMGVREELSAAVRARPGRGNLRGHRLSPSGGVAPPDVCASRGLSYGDYTRCR